jgi:hypothetical protein
MKKIILTIATAMISVFATAQNSITQSILETSGYSSIHDLSYRKVGNLGGGGPATFKLCSSMNPTPKVECQGAMFFLSGSITPREFDCAGYVCYFPKEIWNNEQLKNLWMQDNSHWILMFMPEQTYGTKHTFIGSDYEMQLTEWDENNNVSTGQWYINTTPTNNGYGNTFGFWWNGKQFEQGFKSLYLVFTSHF